MVDEFARMQMCRYKPPNDRLIFRESSYVCGFRSGNNQRACPLPPSIHHRLLMPPYRQLLPQPFLAGAVGFSNH